jgi:hypothetical protein
VKGFVLLVLAAPQQHLLQAAILPYAALQGWTDDEGEDDDRSYDEAEDDNHSEEGSDYDDELDVGGMLGMTADCCRHFSMSD